MIAFIIAILEFVGGLIPALIKSLRRNPDGPDAWKSQLTYWQGRPRSIVPNFFGRRAELTAIRDAFKSKQVVILSGGPGVGKSQLASEYAHKSKRKGFWTPVGETSEQTLTALAPHLGIDQTSLNPPDVAFQVCSRLTSLSSKTIWVVDNLANLDQLNSLLNDTASISLLVTTQDGRDNVVPAADFQKVGVLDMVSAVRLLCKSGRYDLNDRVFTEIVEEVGRQARAVEALSVQLGAAWETPAQVLEELRRTPNRLELETFKRKAPGLQIPREESLYAALRGPLDALPPEVREQLSPLGYTADLPMSRSFVEGMTGLTGGELNNFFEQCTARSVLAISGNQVSIHSLTRATIAASTPEGGIQAALGRASLRLNDVDQLGVLVLVSELAHHQSMLDWSRDILNPEEGLVLGFSNNLAIAYQNAGRYREATEVHWSNAKVFEQVLGGEDPITLSSQNNLAAAYGVSGRYEDAARVFKEVLEVRERVLGKEHPDTLSGRNNLAAATGAGGRYEDAAQIFKEVLEVRERVLGKEHPDTLTSRNNLAEAHRNAGRYGEAAGLHWSNLEVRERVLGKEHRDTLVSRNNLAEAHRNAGRYEQAAGLHWSNVGVMERVLGEEHPDTLASRNNLAEAHRNAGRYEQAAGLHWSNLEIMERVLGKEHPDTLASRNNLANAYDDLGRYEQAAGLQWSNLEVMERVLGEEHPDTLSSRSNLAAAYGGIGRYDEAIDLHRSNLEVRERVLGSEHPDALTSRHNLAAAYGGAGRYGEAARLFAEALRAQEQVLGPEHPHTLATRNNLAIALRAMGRHAEADALFSEEPPPPAQ